VSPAAYLAARDVFNALCRLQYVRIAVIVFTSGSVTRNRKTSMSVLLEFALRLAYQHRRPVKLGFQPTQ